MGGREDEGLGGGKKKSEREGGRGRELEVCIELS